MRYLAVIFTMLFFISCTKEKETLMANYNIDIQYYKLPGGLYRPDSIMQYSENIAVSHKKDSIDIFVYYYKNLTDVNDTITIKGDSIFKRDEKLFFISKKVFTLNSKPFEVKKYNVDSNHPHGFSNVFVNDSLGMILWRNYSSNNIVEYDTKNLKTIHKAIIADSLFFTPEWK